MYLSELTITALALLSTSVLIGLPLSAVSNEQRLKMPSRLPFSCCGAYTFRPVIEYISASELSPRSTQSVFTFQPLSSFDEDIQDNKEKLQQHNRIKCLSERATDNHGDKSYCGRPRTKHHAPTLTVSSHANQRP
ncbi:hypothetical protein T11_11562 [Trichinella zimbabwensis]|uniref:Uncharacterized protein n=1 Tax=Trichinella zimbabwensis TaxID=268475 RepID=A0A0V1H0U1_9BILA|nr:hypothetical protein T11_11562 [Trichinella zimbabwensis]